VAGALVLIGVLGAAVGSFLNVIIYRLPRGESVVVPRSRCPGCDVAIRARDNVPLVSWLVLKGRCRSCGAAISPRYPLVELLTALVFVGVVLARGVDVDLALELPFAAALIAIAGIDLEHRVVPNRIVVPAAVFGVAAAALVASGHLPSFLLAGAIAFGALLAAALAYPAGMGMGDVKLAGVMGLYLGAAVAPALFVAFFAGAVVGVAILMRDGAAARKRAVPFAPFLALGGFVGLVAGPELVHLYASRFLG
jgi:leader peptidase (prepilin peptidase)/N-methyltransferase